MSSLQKKTKTQQYRVKKPPKIAIKTIELPIALNLGALFTVLPAIIPPFFLREYNFYINVIIFYISKNQLGQLFTQIGFQVFASRCTS